MSTIIIALLLVGTIALVIVLLVSANNRNEKKRRKKIFKQLNQLGVDNGLSFSSQELFGKEMLALDAVNRKLVIMKDAGEAFDADIISLDDIQRCSIKKDYANIIHNDKKPHLNELLLNEILLQLNFKDSREPVVIRFYDINLHSLYQLPERQARANDWEIMLSKLAGKQGLYRA